MKKVLIFLLFGFALTTCRKSIFDEGGFYGEGSARMNGKAWTGKAGIFMTDVFCKTDSCIAVKLLYLNAQGLLRGDITLDHIPLRTGRQTLNYIWPNHARTFCQLTYSEYIDDGDVTTGGYFVFEQNPDNYVEITGINYSTGGVSGKFQATVVRDSLWTFPGYKPDTIRIREGVFFGRIYEK